jgi:hypothetical protein
VWSSVDVHRHADHLARRVAGSRTRLQGAVES